MSTGCTSSASLAPGAGSNGIGLESPGAGGNLYASLDLGSGESLCSDYPAAAFPSLPPSPIHLLVLLDCFLPFAHHRTNNYHVVVAANGRALAAAVYYVIRDRRVDLAFFI